MPYSIRSYSPGLRTAHLSIDIPERKELLVIGGTGGGAKSGRKGYCPLEMFTLSMMKPAKIGGKDMLRKVAAGITAGAITLIVPSLLFSSLITSSLPYTPPVDILHKMEKWTLEKGKMKAEQKLRRRRTKKGAKWINNVLADKVKTVVKESTLTLEVEGRRVITKPMSYGEFKTKTVGKVAISPSSILRSASPDPVGVAWYVRVSNGRFMTHNFAFFDAVCV